MIDSHTNNPCSLVRRISYIVRAVTLTAIALPIIAGAPRSIAQTPADEAPVFGAKQKRDLVSFDSWEAMLELIFQRTQNKIDDKPSHESDNENLFTETFTLKTHGAVIHPNVLELNLAGTFGLRQRDFQEDLNGVHSSESDNTTVTGYDLNAAFLRNQTTSFTLYAQRYEETVNRDFGASLINTTSTYGAIADVRLQKFPTRIQIYHMEQSLDDPLNVQGYTQKQDTALWHTEWVPSDRSRLTFDYSFNSVNEKAQLAQPVSFDVQQVSLSHVANFGKDLRNNLTSTLDYLNQTGDFPEDRLRLDERLTFQHTPNLQSYYRYTYTQDSRENFDQTDHQGEIGFEHKLYQSLITRGAVGFQVIDTQDSQSSQEWYARLDFNYTKKVPYGVLGLSLAGGYDYRNNEAQTSAIEIIDEPHTFTDPLGVVIVRTNIEPRSIVVTDTSRLRLFVPGVDYTVAVLPNRVELRRIFGGAIADNQGVLVDYTVGPQPANTQDTFNFALGGRYDIDSGPFKGLAVYARYFYQQQSINSEVSSFFIPDNIHDLTVGAEYRIGAFTFTTEQVWHDSTLAPYNSTRFGASYNQRIIQPMVLSLGANYQIIDYTDINDHVTYLNLAAGLDYEISRELHATLSATYRDQTDTLFGNTRGFEQQLQVQWRHRQTYVYALVRNVTLENEGQDSAFQFFQIGIQRRF
jgi:hypothetical protein